MAKQDKFAQYMRALSPRSALASANIERWQAAGRGTLLVALAVCALQYYTLHVYVKILSLPVLVI